MTDNSKLIQGRPEWHAARIGKITGSRFKDVLSRRGATRANYMRELLLERKTGRAVQGFYNAEMEWGLQTEPQARAYYEKITRTKVEQVGFIDHPLEQYRGYVGVSPDGLLGSAGCIEIKCPNTSTHLEYIAKDVLPSKYVAQVQGVMWVTERRWCEFISFDPRVPENPYWHVYVMRDESYINKLAAAVDVFIQEMVEMQKNQTEVDPQLLIDVTEGGCSDLDWQLKMEQGIRGKCRTLFVCAKAQAGESMTFRDEKGEYITFKSDAEYNNRVVEYMMTGE